MCQKALQLDPKFSVETFVKWQGLKDRGHCDRMRAALIAAGLPE